MQSLCSRLAAARALRGGGAASAPSYSWDRESGAAYAIDSLGVAHKQGSDANPLMTDAAASDRRYAHKKVHMDPSHLLAQRERLGSVVGVLVPGTVCPHACPRMHARIHTHLDPFIPVTLARLSTLGLRI